MQFTIIRKFLVSKLIVLSIVMLMCWYDTSSDEIFNSLLKLRTSKITVHLENSIVSATKVTKSSSF